MSLAAEVVFAAREAGVKLATAESCTGGLLAAALTDIAGASAVFDRGFITYSYSSKPEMLGVTSEILDAYGAVSREAVMQMAQGALAKSDADIAVAITGIAGPSLGSAKPEGLVWFGVSTVEGTVSDRCEFGVIGRSKVRHASVNHALQLLAEVLKLPRK